jgi:hypothetical protein
MNTKDIVLIGAGIVAGYLLVDYLKKGKEEEMIEESVTQEQAELPLEVQAKIDSCNKEVDAMMANSRFTAKTDLTAVRKGAFDACMAKKTP